MFRRQQSRSLDLASVVLALLALWPRPIASSVIVVDGDGSDRIDDGVCTLPESISSANDNLPSGATPGECIAGDDAPPDGDIIVLTMDVTLTEALPATVDTLTVSGNGFTVARDPSVGPFSVFSVAFFGRLDVSDITVTGGLAEDGGGFFLNGVSELFLNNSTVTGNHATDDGGGIQAGNFYGRARVTLTNSTISANSADFDGGGVYITNYGSLTVVNSTISGNAAGDQGGGVYIGNFVEGTLTNSTLVANTALDDGAATHQDFTARLREKNTIIAANIGGDSCSLGPFARFANVSGRGAGGGFFNNFTDDFSCSGDLIVPGLDIRLDLADNGGSTMTHALTPGSVAIDAADDCGLDTDQRGFRRDALCDSGSYEFGAATPLTLELAGSCPGEITASVFDASPNSPVAFARGRGQGMTVVEVGACVGTELDLADARIATIATTDGDGSVAVLLNVPDGFCDVALQVVDGATCGVSNLATLPSLR